MVWLQKRCVYAPWPCGLGFADSVILLITMLMWQEEVRQWAAKLQLPNQARRDSQGICFLGKVRFSEFVREHLGTWPGPIVEEETDDVVGHHDGFWFYTLGQRKGIYLSGGPW